MPSLGLFKGTGVMGQSTVGMSHESSQCREPANSRNITWYFIHGEPCLKGPKLEIFVAEFFTQSKPVWVDDLETRN
jgi:hypothetical protein